MSRQSDIKDGLKRILGDERLVAKTLSFLEKEKVVIKVERELPLIRPSIVSQDPHINAMGRSQQSAWQTTGQRAMLQDMFKAGYVAVEPLIKEE